MSCSVRVRSVLRMASHSLFLLILYKDYFNWDSIHHLSEIELMIPLLLWIFCDKVSILTDRRRPKEFIIDDAMFERNRSKKVELLARCMDHSSNKAVLQGIPYA
jgi:hypothetical protein